MMTATQIGVKQNGAAGGKPIYDPTGDTFGVYSSINDWVAAKLKSGIAVTSANGRILVPKVKDWAAFEETDKDGNVIVTVFELTN